MKNKHLFLATFCLIALMSFLMYFSAKHDSLTFDEKAHIGAGITYLQKQDYRVNPEHPPLAKDISALGLIGKNIKFPVNDDFFNLNKENTTEFNGQVINKNIEWWRQFNLGNNILFKENGNRADEIILSARIPMMILTIVLGLLLFFVAWKWFGKHTALLTLFFFCLSPTFIAHGRLVTIDIVAAFGLVLATYLYLEFLKNPNNKNILLAGLGFGIAMISKFSLILLIPYFGIMAIVWPLVKKQNVLEYILKTFAIGFLGLVLVVWPVYSWHLSGEPVAKQIFDVQETIKGNPIPVARDFVYFLMNNSITRPIGYWAFGVLMAGQRTVWGNSTYFMGGVASNGWKEYFPTLYMLKEALAFHVLTILALIYLAINKIKFLFKKDNNKFSQLVYTHLPECAMFLWLIIYWGIALVGNLNIGLRHIIPVIPFTYILVALGINKIYRTIEEGHPMAKKMFTTFLFAMIAWQIVAVVGAFPYYISYFNEIVGIDNGYKVATDSNYDWGQDFGDLVAYINNNKIDKIKISYFGGADLDYYLKGKYEMLDVDKGKQKGWIAISLNQLQGQRAVPVRNYDLPTDKLMWLNNYQPVARAGKSILIYHIEK
jgi:hypothetical protein